MQFGEVVSTVILVEKGGTGLSRGCAFVSYTEMSAAHAAIAALDNQTMLPDAPYNLRVSRLRAWSIVRVLVVMSWPWFFVRLPCSDQ